MAYTWTTGETITADKLNNTPGAMMVTETNGVLDKTWKEIHDAIFSGTVVYLIKTQNLEHSVYIKYDFLSVEYGDYGYLLKPYRVWCAFGSNDSYYAYTENDYPELVSSQDSGK